MNAFIIKPDSLFPQLLNITEWINHSFKNKNKIKRKTQLKNKIET